MEDRHCFALQRQIKETSILCIVIILAAAIRFYHSVHPFLSDEAFNLITIEKLVERHEFDDYFFRHPPFYLLISAFFFWLFGLHPYIPSFVSVLFSSLSIIPFYLVVKSSADRFVALCACAILAVIPANIYYSGWIKQEGMLIFFFTWAIFFYLKGRYWAAGILTGLSLLTKEFAVFFFPLSLFIAIFKNNKERWANIITGWFKMTVAAGIVSSWWYLIFGASFYKIAGEALIGGNVKELAWHSPWWFYIKNLPQDLSYPVFSLFIIGFAVIVREVCGRRLQFHHGLHLLWIAVLYLPLSAVVVKTPWYIYLTTPAFAFIAALGLKYITDLLRLANIKPMMAAVAVISLIAFSVFHNSGQTFYERVSPLSPSPVWDALQIKKWNELEEKREMWREKIGGHGKVGFLEFHPILQYLAGIPTNEVVLLRPAALISLDRAGLSNTIKLYDIKVFIINTDSLIYSEKFLEDITSMWGTPEKIGPLLVFMAK